MRPSLEEQWKIRLNKLQERESFLEQQVQDLQIEYSGLKDIDTLLELINLKFNMALKAIEGIATRPADSSREALGELAREKSRQAVSMLEDLRGENISLDQTDLISGAAGFKEAKRLFNLLLLKGGAVFFEAKIEEAKIVRKLARIIAEAINKYTSPDDRYAQVFKTEKLPEILRKLVNLFLPVLAPENQKEPPYGIEEGEEFACSAERIKMPLSQAIFYLENELLPRIEKELQANPGNPILQRRLRFAAEKIEEYKRIKYIPRSTPLIMEKGFYTDWWTEYSADGEIMVTVDLTVHFKSGTNLERIQELIQAEITRKAAGRGICPALDEEYAYLKSLESGKRGSSRLPGFKINTAKGFKTLAASYPLLKRLEDKEELKKLISLARQRGKTATQKQLGRMLLTGSDSILPSSSFFQA